LLDHVLDYHWSREVHDNHAKVPIVREHLIVCPFGDMMRESKAIPTNPAAEVEAESVRVVMHHIFKMRLDVLPLLSSLEHSQHVEVILHYAVTPRHTANVKAVELVKHEHPSPELKQVRKTMGV